MVHGNLQLLYDCGCFSLHKDRTWTIRLGTANLIAVFIPLAEKEIHHLNCQTQMTTASVEGAANWVLHCWPKSSLPQFNHGYINEILFWFSAAKLYTDNK
jgi:hypothetical protein